MGQLWATLRLMVLIPQSGIQILTTTFHSASVENVTIQARSLASPYEASRKEAAMPFAKWGSPHLGPSNQSQMPACPSCWPHALKGTPQMNVPIKAKQQQP